MNEYAIMAIIAILALISLIASPLANSAMAEMSKGVATANITTLIGNTTDITPVFPPIPFFENSWYIQNIPVGDYHIIVETKIPETTVYATLEYEYAVTTIPDKFGNYDISYKFATEDLGVSNKWGNLDKEFAIKTGMINPVIRLHGDIPTKLQQPDNLATVKVT